MDDAFAPWTLVVKLGLYGSVLLTAGLAAHVSLNIIEAETKARALRSAVLLVLLALVFSVLRLAVTNAQLGGGFDKALDAATLAWTWPALAASSIAIALGAAAMIAAWLLRIGALAALAAIALAASFALTGHTQALETPGIAPWAVTLHVLIAAFWFAAPLSLWPAACLSGDVLAARATRFTRYALVLVPLLFALGIWLAWRLAGGWSALITSLYGQLLLAKLGAATGALALGAYNKNVVTQMLRERPDHGRRALMATLSFDTALFLTALVLVGVATTFVGPPTD